MTFIKYSSFALLLCLSLHACNARDRSLGVMKKEHEKRFQFSSKNHEKDSVVANSEHVGPANEMNSVVANSELAGRDTRNEMDDIVMNSEPVRADTKNEKEIVAANSETVKPENESLVHLKASKVVVEDNGKLSFVNWIVPHKKKGRQQPSFNVDYAPPKTHPPSHN